MEAFIIGGVDGMYFVPTSHRAILTCLHTRPGEQPTAEDAVDPSPGRQSGAIKAPYVFLHHCASYLSTNNPSERACVRGEIKRMYYTSFDDQITAKHGVVRENWVGKFQSPSTLTFIEAEMLIHALENGVTTFRSLSNAEWADWRRARYTPQAIAAPADSGLPSTDPSSVDTNGGRAKPC